MLFRSQILVGGNIAAGYRTTNSLVFFSPTYTFADPLLGGQFAISGSVPFGVGQTSTSAQLSEPNGAALSAFRSETLTAYGDFSPTLTLKWALGPHNFMGYVTANVPTGYYSPSNIASLGLGSGNINDSHWTSSAGGESAFLAFDPNNPNAGGYRPPPDALPKPQPPAAPASHALRVLVAEDDGPSQLIVRKLQPSAFFGTNLVSWLQMKGVDTVLVTGCGLSETRDGGYAEFARVPGDAVVPLPAGLDLRRAMALGTAGFTAALAIDRMEHNGQTPDKGPIAVTGATGGVGSLAIDMLKGRGYRVVAISSKPDPAINPPITE